MKKPASSRFGGRAVKKKPAISQSKGIPATRLDDLHDAGEDLTSYLDLSRATRPGRTVQRVNVDFPVDLLNAIDREAKRIGVSRQAFIKMRLADTIPSR
jgi:hypothetical protein